MLVNAKIRHYVTFGKYADNSFKELFDEVGIKVDILDKPSDKISFLNT